MPFNPVDKRTAITYIDSDGNWYRASKGSPEQVCSLFTIKRSHRNTLYLLLAPNSYDPYEKDCAHEVSLKYDD